MNEESETTNTNETLPSTNEDIITKTNRVVDIQAKLNAWILDLPEQYKPDKVLIRQFNGILNDFSKLINSKNLPICIYKTTIEKEIPKTQSLAYVGKSIQNDGLEKRFAQKTYKFLSEYTRRTSNKRTSQTEKPFTWLHFINFIGDSSNVLVESMRKLFDQYNIPMDGEHNARDFIEKVRKEKLIDKVTKTESLFSMHAS